MESNNQVTEVRQAPLELIKKKGTYAAWTKGFFPGLMFGLIFLALSIAMIVIENLRILLGSINKNGSGSFALYPNNIYYPARYSPTDSINVERQHHYLWPWSHPALLFTIPVFIASLFGFSSGRRGTYSTIYLFFTFSLISTILSPFLIGYFATNVARHSNGHTGYEWDTYQNLDRSFSIVMIVLSSVLAFTGALASILGALGFGCCIRKGDSYLAPIRRRALYNFTPSPVAPYATYTNPMYPY